MHEIIEIYLEEEEVKDGIDIEKYWNIYIFRYRDSKSAYQAEKRATTAAVASRQMLPYVFEVQMFQ